MFNSSKIILDFYPNVFRYYNNVYYNSNNSNNSNDISSYVLYVNQVLLTNLSIFYSNTIVAIVKNKASFWCWIDWIALVKICCFFANKNYVLKDNLHTCKKITKTASVEFLVFGKIRQTVEIKVLSNENWKHLKKALLNYNFSFI